MPDKRKFHVFLNRLKDETPSDIGLIESIQKKFEEDIETISDKEKKALKQFPMQFVKRIVQDDMGWTSKLHVWAEQGIPEILDIDPILLAFKNGYGDSVLMSLVASATGTYTEVNNYDLLQKILDKDFTYEDVNTDDEGNEKVIECNAFDEVDLNEQTPLEYLIDFAYAKGDYEGMKPEPIIQEMLQEFASDYQESDTNTKYIDKSVVKQEKTEKENTNDEYTDYDKDIQTEDMGTTDIVN